MESLPEPLEITLKVTRVFDLLEIPYLIGGSLASALYGIVRATMDADLVAEIEIRHIPMFVERLKEEFYIDPEMILDAIHFKSSFNLIHLTSMFKVDVFILKQRPFDLEQMQRREKKMIGDSPENQFFFSTAEDIILAKLEWFRAGGEVSERQWRDILGVLDIQSSQLNFNYLKQWAANLEVLDLLQRGLKEVNINFP